MRDYPAFLVDCLGSVGLAWGTATVVPQFLQRTVFPRVDSGTARTLRQVRFGHMMRTVSFAMGVSTPAQGIIGLRTVGLERQRELDGGRVRCLS